MNLYSVGSNQVPRDSVISSNKSRTSVSIAEPKRRGMQKFSFPKIGLKKGWSSFGHYHYYSRSL